MGNWDFDKLMTSKSIRRKTVPIVMDGEWAQRLFDAQTKVVEIEAETRQAGLRTQRLPEIERLREEIAELEAQKDDKVCDFVLRSISEDRYERLVKAHPPTKEQRQRASLTGLPVNWNEDTFPVALIHACLVEPALTLEQLTELRESDDWNTSELADLFLTAQQLSASRPRLA